MPTNQPQPVLVQAYDKSVVKEYYKIIPKFFGTSEYLLRADRLEHEIHLKIMADKLPDLVFFEGKEYKLVPNF